MRTPRLTRRALLATTGAGALGAVAGCSGVLGDDETEVTLMIERVSSASGGDTQDGHDHSHEEDDHEEDNHGGVPMDVLAHTCAHLEDLDPFSLDAGDSQEGAAAADAHEPYTVTLPGDTGYVAFEPSEDAQWGFFVAGASVTVAAGTTTSEETEVQNCDAIDRHTVIEAENGEIVVELAAD